MALTDILTYLVQQFFVLLGIIIFAWVLGLSFARGISKELKDKIPAWIHSFRKEMTEERAISKALEGRKKYGAE